MNILRFNNFAGFVLFFLLFASACSKDDSIDDQQYKGWAVGQASGGYGTILSTTNDGMTWSRQGSQSQAAGVDLYDIHGLDQNNAWAVGGIFMGYGLILHTTDGGTTWARQGTAAQVPDVRLYSVHAVDANTVWVAGENGALLYTKDGGNSWTSVNVSSLPPTNFYALASFGTTSLWAVGAASDTAFTDTIGLIYHSSDGGATWARQGIGYQFPRKFLDASAGSESTIFLAGSNTVYKSTNGGSIWQNVLMLPNKNMNGICAADVENIWAVGDGDGIYHSTNGGVSWSTIYPSLTGFRLMGVTVADVNRVWIVGAPSSGTGAGNIIYSRNAGSTWFIQSSPVEAGFRRVSFAAAVR
jgi:photosystem II stability/assembly factor-like uncharacterized protein